MEATEQPEGMSFLNDMPLKAQNWRLLKDNVSLFRNNKSLGKIIQQRELKIKELKEEISDYKETLETCRAALHKANMEMLQNKLNS